MIKKVENKVIYQIYPMSFCDSNNDGFGDLKGIISKLDYINSLSVDYIWLTPITESPMFDSGYDVSNYKKINKIFGNMNDLKELIFEAKKRKIKIMMDIVMNHTSDEHDWFKKSIKNIHPYKDFYIWRDFPIDDKESQFGSKRWTYNKNRKQYYFHHFSKKQPDINWENSSLIKIYSEIINFWIAKGIKGFRFDVIDMLGKKIDDGKIIDLQRAYKIIRKMGVNSWLKKDIFTVGECWSTGSKKQLEYINKKNGVFTTCFNAGYMDVNFIGDRWNIKPVNEKILIKIKDWIYKNRSINEAKSNIANFIENHDFPRSISRYFVGNEYLKKKSKLILITFFGFFGPSFIFQGQELGMSNPIISPKEYKDIETKKYLESHISSSSVLKNASKGTRDNARSMLAWDKLDKIKWINYKENNPIYVDQELNNNNSIYNFYKKFINFKKNNYYFFKKAQFCILNKSDGKIFAYKYFTKKKSIYFVSNWSDKIIKNKIKELPIKRWNKYESKIIVKNYGKYSII